jgi:hypothetical protein
MLGNSIGPLWLNTSIMATCALSCSAVLLYRRASEQQQQQQETEEGPAAWWASMFVKAGRMGSAQRESKQPKIRVHGFSEQDQTALYMQVGRAGAADMVQLQLTQSQSPEASPMREVNL